MTSVIIISKLGNKKILTIKKYDESELFKKAGFRSPVHFECQTVWNVEMPGTSKHYSISLFAKKEGNAGQENKYEFPPPVDNLLLFGSCVLVNKTTDGKAVSISLKEWESIVEHLHGGYYDLGDEDTEISEDDEEDLDKERTKEGYVKDDFIVDDDECDNEDNEEEEEEDLDKLKKKAKKIIQKCRAVVEEQAKPKRNAKKKIISTVDSQQLKIEKNIYLDCNDELETEEFS